MGQLPRYTSNTFPGVFDTLRNVSFVSMLRSGRSRLLVSSHLKKLSSWRFSRPWLSQNRVHLLQTSESKFVISHTPRNHFSVLQSVKSSDFKSLGFLQLERQRCCSEVRFVCSLKPGKLLSWLYQERSSVRKSVRRPKSGRVLSSLNWLVSSLFSNSGWNVNEGHSMEVEVLQSCQLGKAWQHLYLLAMISVHWPRVFCITKIGKQF